MSFFIIKKPEENDAQVRYVHDLLLIEIRILTWVTIDP